MHKDIFLKVGIALGVFLVSAILSPLFAKNKKIAGYIQAILTTIAASILLHVGYVVLTSDSGSFEIHISIANTHLPLLIDGLSVLILSLIAIVGTASSWYSMTSGPATSLC